MIIEGYVSYETAKLLAEKGFDYYPDESYWLIDANNVMYWVSRIGAYDYVDVPIESFQRPKNGYRAVTQAMAMKWLRETHGLNVYARAVWKWEEVVGYDWFIESLSYNSYSKTNTEEPFRVYEEACEAAIKYCLENLI